MFWFGLYVARFWGVFLVAMVFNWGLGWFDCVVCGVLVT